MDTSAAESADVDSLGRRTGPRRQHTIEEKLRMVLETHVRGASVATVDVASHTWTGAAHIETRISGIPPPWDDRPVRNLG